MSAAQRNASELLLDFRQAVSDALTNFELWMMFDHPDHRSHRETLQRFAHYFSVVRQAHLATAVVSLYRLFETRRDSVNYERVIEAIEHEQPGFKSRLPDLNGYIDPAQATWRKICTVRNEVFGHRTRDRSEADSFAKAELSIAEVDQMIEACQRIVEELQKALDGTAPIWPGAHEDTFLELLGSVARTDAERSLAADGASRRS